MNLHLYAGPSQSVDHLHIKGWHGPVVEHLATHTWYLSQASQAALV